MCQIACAFGCDFCISLPDLPEWNSLLLHTIRITLVICNPLLHCLVCPEPCFAFCMFASNKFDDALVTATVRLTVLNINNQHTCPRGLLVLCPGLAYHNTHTRSACQTLNILTKCFEGPTMCL